MLDFPEIPGCKIEHVLGKGGVATVFLGIQEKLNRKVAIKVLEPSLLRAEETAARFEREAEIAANLSHSNIVQIISTGKAGKYHYIVMEHLDSSLKDLMRKDPKGRVHPQIALDIIEEIMKALDYAHSRGIYHRDIKPDNIMFRQDSTPVLVDFGIARLYNPSDDLTKDKRAMGTIFYMSPEQCRSQQEVDGRSDIYSLGVVLYEILTGKKPYKGETLISIAYKHIEEPVPVLPPELSRYQPLLDKMMAKDKEKRMANRTQFGQELYRILTGPQSAPRQTAPAPPPTAAPVSIPMQAPLASPAEETLISQPTGPPATLPEMEVPDFGPQEPGEETKRQFVKSRNLLKEKWELFAGFMKKNITPKIDRFLNIVKDWLIDFKTNPGGKKVKIVSLVGSASIILVMLIVLISSLSKSKNPGEQEKARSPLLTYRQKKEQEYKDKFKQASQYIEKNDFKAVVPVLSELKKINHTPQVKDLEKKSNRLQGKLRSGYEAAFSYGDIKEMILRYNFFENLINSSGTFSSHYESAVKNSAAVVMCFTTGLMWHDGELPGSRDFQKAENWINRLNREKYGGYTDWRFPSLEEAGSLLRKRKNMNGLHIDPVFSINPRTIWTGDRIAPGEYWVVDFDGGNMKVSTGGGEHQVWPVRSVTQDDT